MEEDKSFAEWVTKLGLEVQAAAARVGTLCMLGSILADRHRVNFHARYDPKSSEMVLRWGKGDRALVKRTPSASGHTDMSEALAEAEREMMLHENDLTEWLKGVHLDQPSQY